MILRTTSRTVLKRARVGLTLIEILIALTMTLIVLGAMMSAFQYASAEMQNGRAMLEMANRVRVSENLLRRDLANLTVEPRPYIGKVIPNGYFEYVEGPRRDLTFPFGFDADGDGIPLGLDASDTAAGTPNAAARQTLLNGFQGPTNSYAGDVDDVLAFTVRSVAGQNFRGRVHDYETLGDLTDDTEQIVESDYAEIIWWTQFNDAPGGTDSALDYTESVTVFRRVLLIINSQDLENLDVTGVLPVGVPYNSALNWLATSDISARIIVNPVGVGYNVVPNTLQGSGQSTQQVRPLSKPQ